jgi:chromosomal replication initiator protein
VVDYLIDIPLPGRTLASPAQTSAHDTAPTALPSFVAGPENRLVAATLNRLLEIATPEGASFLARDTARRFAPATLALFGPSGVGKTHLAHGLVRHWQRARGDDAAQYTTAADFRRHFNDAIDSNHIEGWRSDCRDRRMLAIDDIHRLPNEDYLMQELRHTLDAIEENHGLLIVTSLRPTDTLFNLPADIRGRLASGLSLQLAPPGAAARVRIIRYASTALGRDLSNEAASKLAEGVADSATQLFGALFDLWSTPGPSGADDADRAAQVLAARAGRQPSLQDITALVARYTKVPQKLLKSSSRRQSIVGARAIVVYLARQLSAASYDQIGRALGGRDHTTIMHSYKKIERQLSHDAATRETVAELCRILRCC